MCVGWADSILQKHIKRQIISLNGGFQVIADLNAYNTFVTSLKVRSFSPPPWPSRINIGFRCALGAEYCGGLCEFEDVGTCVCCGGCEGFGADC